MLSRVLVFLLATLACRFPVYAGETRAAITIDASMTTTVVNPLFFGHNLVFSGNGLWHTKLNDVDPGAVPFVKNLSPTIVRFPGGNISDLYIWEDGIGYRTTTSVTSTDSSIILEAAPFWGTGQKARFIDSDGGQFGDPFSFTRLAGKQIEGVAGLHATHAAGAQMRLEAREGQPDWTSNTYGSDEHMKFVESIAAQAILTVNYGTGLDKAGKVSTTASLSQRVKRAAAWVAYLNGSPTDTRPFGVDAEGTDWQTVGYWAQKRVARGRPAPYGVHYWEIGNEVFGSWETGHTTVHQYASDFSVFASTMKSIDPTIQVGAVGMADPHGRGDADRVEEWNATVVRTAGDALNFLAVHPYYPAATLIQAQDSYTTPSWFTAVMAGAQQAVVNLTALRAVITANSPRAGQIGVAITEYGIWPADSTDARDFSNLARALYDTDLLMSLLQQGTKLGVTLATAWNLHGSNQTAAIRYDWSTGARTLRPQYQAFQLLRSALKRQPVRTTVSSPSFATQRLANVAASSTIPVLAALATTDAQSGRLNLLVLNRRLADAIETTIQFNGFLPAATVQVQTLHGSSIQSHNEDRVPAVGIESSSFSPASPSFTYTFPPHSLTSLEFSTDS